MKTVFTTHPLFLVLYLFPFLFPSLSLSDLFPSLHLPNHLLATSWPVGRAETNYLSPNYREGMKESERESGVLEIDAFLNYVKDVFLISEVLEMVLEKVLNQILLETSDFFLVKTYLPIATGGYWLPTIL